MVELNEDIIGVWFVGGGGHDKDFLLTISGDEGKGYTLYSRLRSYDKEDPGNDAFSGKDKKSGTTSKLPGEVPREFLIQEARGVVEAARDLSLPNAEIFELINDNGIEDFRQRFVAQPWVHAKTVKTSQDLPESDMAWHAEGTRQVSTEKEDKYLKWLADAIAASADSSKTQPLEPYQEQIAKDLLGKELFLESVGKLPRLDDMPQWDMSLGLTKGLQMHLTVACRILLCAMSYRPGVMTMYTHMLGSLNKSLYRVEDLNMLFPHGGLKVEVADELWDAQKDPSCINGNLLDSVRRA